MVLGALEGYDDPKDPAAKKEHYARVQEFARRFKEENGTIVCRDLLANVPTVPGGEPEARTPEFYKRRPCARLIRQAAGIAEEMLASTAAEPADE